MSEPRDEDAPREDGLFDRTPPHDLLAEQSAIGSMLLSRDVVDDVLAEARPEDFYIPKHELIFDAILALTMRGEPTDVISVAAELQRTGTEQRAGGAEYLHQLTALVLTTANASWHAARVAERAGRRGLIEAGTRAVQMGYASEGATEDLVEAARAEIDQVRARKRHELRMIGENLDALVDELETQPDYLPSPWPSLNTMIGGFAKGELTVIAARPGEGKTIVILQAALKAARSGTVAFSSLEMQFKELQLRMVSQFGPVHMTHLRNHDMSEIDWHSFYEAQKQTKGAPVFIDDSGASGQNTVGDIRAHARQVAKRGHLAAVFVDYLQLVEGPGADRRLVVDGISRSFKQLAQELNVPVIVAAQLNRGQPGRGGVRPEPTLRDLRESGGIEQDADAVFLLHRPGDKRPKDLDVLVAKNRHGQQGKVTLRWEAEYARVIDQNWRQSPLFDMNDRGMQ